MKEGEKMEAKGNLGKVKIYSLEEPIGMTLAEVQTSKCQGKYIKT